MDALALVDQFVDALNAHDPTTMSFMLSENHRFIDSLGGEVRGRDEMRKAWASYFAMVPDYRLRVDNRLIAGGTIVLLGKAGGTYWTGGDFRPENKWETPAAIRVAVRDGLIAEWQVYADNEPLRKLMRF